MGELSFNENLIEQSITVSDTEIVIAGHLFVHKDYSVTNKELLMDVLGTHYRGQKIKVFFWDGENVQFSQFVDFIKYACDFFSIPVDDVHFESHDPDVMHFSHTHMRLGIFLSTGREVPASFKHDYADGKFVGTMLGRFNPTRLRLAYELDRAFPGDNYAIFQPKLAQIQQDYRHVSSIYTNELAWLQSKQFDADMSSQFQSGTIEWLSSLKRYPAVCNNYQIEVISETDAFSNFWFTEKTARCLAIGKPFVLVAGTASLARLHDMGFLTYGQHIDESYDLVRTPAQRIDAIIKSLADLYTNDNKASIISDMYATAELNKLRYKEYTND